MVNGPDERVLERPPCPHCKAPLPSPRARQCLRCHTDWHDATNVHQVDIGNWNRLGIDPDKDYVVELCQKPDGSRFTRYRQYPHGVADPFAVFETDPASAQKFLSWGFYEYAEHVKLSNGQSFGFDAHGVWLTDVEWRCIDQDWAGQDTPWVRGIPPNLSPK